MNGGIALFVKTPGLSPVKTRLAAGLGRAQAEAVFIACAEATAEVLQRCGQLGGVATYWAIAEYGHQAVEWWSARGGLSVIHQGEGGLGARMARVHQQLVRDCGFGLLIGADAPQLEVDALLQAADWLRAPTPRQVLGLAEDGGFWLYGGNRVAPETLWSKVSYSQPHTADEFRAAFAAYGEWQAAPRLCDLDSIGDIARVRAALAALPAPLPAQRRLFELLERIDA
ncbi:DUF2064 domain-containing protein [Aquimonas sp.]|uniref:TIGR04282 family arsenosugar biosynthesis glycosyltransferase n=1 Tax=Aquimonas sp. TaxID=1872588 RepID=UPI0037C003CE